MTHSLREHWLVASAVMMALLAMIVVTLTLLSDTPVATLNFDRVTPVQADHAAELLGR